MLKRKFLVLFIIAAVLLMSGGAAYAQVQAAPVADDGGITRDTLYVPGEVVVGFEDGAAPRLYRAQAQALAQSLGAQVVEQYNSMALLRFSPDADVMSLAARISTMAGVKYAEPNYISWIPEENPVGEAYDLTEVRLPIATEAGHEWATVSLSALQDNRIKGNISTYPTDPWSNWGWWRSGANIIWRDRHASPTVCVVDTGVDVKHPDLRGRVINGYDFVNDDRIANDDNGHGTHVAGVIAARANNKEGIVGVSNGRVLAVKVLSAQGWGTSFDIASGIRFCADHRAKVINLSLGGPASQTEYEALNYAINEKGVFVAAAAGNEGTDLLSFPAAWASDRVTPDGSWVDATTDPNPQNDLYHALIAVGAYKGDGTWVDLDGDGEEDDGEYFYDCAAEFSNYGEWVEIVAPGVDILSTLPTSYPFYAGYYEGAGQRLDKGVYDWWNGTSMATPFVAASAARIWSTDLRYMTNDEIKVKLLNTDPAWFGLQEAEDPNWASNGTYTGDAPYCWPTEMPDYARVLNVAASMNRAAIRTDIYDAVTGLPLDKAIVRAYAGTSAKAIGQVHWEGPYTYYYYDEDTDTWQSFSWWDGPDVTLINLDADTDYALKVSRSGYTGGAIYAYVLASELAPGGYFWDWSRNVAVPPSRNMTVVAEWPYGDNDLFLWLPAGSPNGVIGPNNVAALPDFIGSGTQRDFPHARYNREGGASDWLPVESITIGLYRGKPYYSIREPYGTYGVYLQPWTDQDNNGLADTDVVIRVWKSGRLIYNTYLPNPGCAVWTQDPNTGEYSGDWWHVLDITADAVLPANSCGSSVPYAEGSVIQNALGGDK